MASAVDRDVLAFAVDLADRAGKLAVDRFYAADFSVMLKSDDTEVTEADHAVETLIRDEIRRNFPNDEVYGEEAGSTAGTSGRPHRAERPCWTVNEAASFLRHRHEVDDRLTELYELLICTGMRKGEALGLHGADVDLDARLLFVRHTLVAVDNSRLVLNPMGLEYSVQRRDVRGCPLAPVWARRRSSP